MDCPRPMHADSIPPELGKLGALTTLDFHDNCLSGEFPQEVPVALYAAG